MPACPQNTDRLRTSKAALVAAAFLFFSCSISLNFYSLHHKSRPAAPLGRECFIKHVGMAVDGPKPFLVWVGVTSQFAGQQHTSEMENFGLLQADIIHCCTKKSLL